jgi:hypothetical protein
MEGRLLRPAGNIAAAGALSHIGLRPLVPTSTHPAQARVPTKEIAMPRRTACSLLAPIALLLATAGCIADNLAVVEAAVAPAALTAEPVGHELHRMFEGEKHDAAALELPAQF